jgi:hypothetical protein
MAPPLLLPTLLLVANQVAAGAAAAPRPHLTAVPVPAPPLLDGEVTSDPAWAIAPPATGFVQQSPDEGQPASEATEVRVVYTKDTLYVGVICFDRAPGNIVLAEGRRDSALDKVDSFRVLLDTFGDRQNAFVFGTTPAGAEFDGQVINDGGGNDFVLGGQQGGSLAGFNLNWDGAWDVRTRVGPSGWSAEIAIPFRTLRYAGGGRQLWGLNFQRVIQARNETSYWAPLGRQQQLYRVSEAGTLDGLDLPLQRNLKLVPYVLVDMQRIYVAAPAPGVPLAPTGRDWDFGADAGGEIKYSVTPSLTLDATVRTDFAQVEVDEQQLQLDRFNLFFPEKRPFFLENAGLFSVGAPGDIDLFFSRRIGIGPAGQVIPIVGGARLSGKVGPARIGLLNMQTEELAGVDPANNFTVARFAWELGNRSSVGAFFSNRQATGVAGWRDDYGRSYAADARWGIGRYGLVSGFFAATQTPGSPERPIAWSVGPLYDGPSWLLEVRASEAGAGFDPQVGFLERSVYRKAEYTALYRWRPEALLGLKELRPHTSGSAYYKPDGYLESRFIHLDNHWEWRNGLELHTGVNLTHEGVQERFEIDPKRMIFVEPGEYDNAEAQIVLQTPPAWPLIFEGTLVAGGFFGGSRLSPRGELLFRAGDLLSAELRWEHNRIRLPEGRFVVNRGLLRLSYSFTPRTFVQALVQYNDRFDIWSSNLRLGWLRDANTGLFVVYNENQGIGDDDALDSALRGLYVRDRSLVVKLSWMFDVL